MQISDRIFLKVLVPGSGAD